MILVQILVMILLTAIGGYLYRLGGIGDPYNTKVRDMGVPTVMVIAMIVLGLFHWSLIISWGLMFGSLTTYWGFWNNPKEDKKWWNWALHGLFISIAMVPTVYFMHLWAGFAIRSVFLFIAMAAWSQNIGDVDLEEGGRGGLSIASLALLLICR